MSKITHVNYKLQISIPWYVSSYSPTERNAVDFNLYKMAIIVNKGHQSNKHCFKDNSFCNIFYKRVKFINL